MVLGTLTCTPGCHRVALRETACFMSLGTLNPRASEGPCEVPAQISGKEGDHGRPGCGDTLRSHGQIIHSVSTSTHQTLKHMPGTHRLHTGRHRYTYRRADRLTGTHTHTHKQVSQGKGSQPLKAVATENPRKVTSCLRLTHDRSQHCRLGFPRHLI